MEDHKPTVRTCRVAGLWTVELHLVQCFLLNVREWFRNAFPSEAISNFVASTERFNRYWRHWTNSGHDSLEGKSEVKRSRLSRELWKSWNKWRVWVELAAGNCFPTSSSSDTRPQVLLACKHSRASLRSFSTHSSLPFPLLSNCLIANQRLSKACFIRAEPGLASSLSFLVTCWLIERQCSVFPTSKQFFAKWIKSVS